MYEKIKHNNGSVQGIKEIPLHLQDKYKTAFEIDQKALIDLAAIRQKHLCQSQSLNLFVSNEKATGPYISGLYEHAWRKGIKTTYYLHTEPASRIVKT